ncbi:hypothetical protein A9Q84_20350 [Halobacteriovorax marinus]|uniref:SH3b domain-containing protein n=1 Tax=Halobacteriovorax marinus TaxID=97084 RepID=A0A1Y5F174_9BACT|nr:hypothetical protein A9Q84_20350 [Halobacteriovorax marinus]
MNELSKSLETLYLDGKFEKAVDLLLESKSALTDVDFHYNLGVVYAKMGELGPGRYHFELAMKKGYLGSDLINNLNVIKSQIQVADISNSDFLADKVINFLSTFPVGYSVSITLVLVAIFLILMRAQLVKSKLIVALALFISTMPPVLHSYLIADKTFAVSMNELKIFEGPSAIYDVKTTLPAGSKFIMGKSDKGWFYIDHPVELSGWVKKEDVGLL